MEKKYKFLQPDYYKEFRCSGGSCKLNCCNYSWKITVDKETYQKYRAVKQPKEFVDKLNKYVKRDRNSKSDMAYARIVQVKEKTKIKFTEIKKGTVTEKEEEVYGTTCVFQDERKLCGIYKYLGEEGLCNTCKVFPRMFNNIYGNYERALSLGCEEVSKLLYNRKEGIGFELVEEKELPYIENYQANLSVGKSPMAMHYDNIRVMCIRILQLDDIHMDDKMILLGAFMFKIDELVKDNKYKEIPNFLESFVDNIDVYVPLFNIEMIKQNEFIDMFIKICLYVVGRAGRADAVFDLQNILTKLRRAYSVKKEASTEEKTDTEERKTDKETDAKEETDIKEETGTEEKTDAKEETDIKEETGTKEKTDVKEETNTEETEEEQEDPLEVLENGGVISKPYMEYKENVNKIMEGKEYYIENMFVHIFFSKGYPYNGRDSIKDGYIKFIWTYCHYKGLLAGAFGERPEFDEEALHRLCTIFGRTCADQEMSLNNVLKEIKENKRDTLAILAILIKSA